MPLPADRGVYQKCAQSKQQNVTNQDGHRELADTGQQCRTRTQGSGTTPMELVVVSVRAAPAVLRLVFVRVERSGKDWLVWPC